MERNPRFLFASDSFKGTLSSKQTAGLLGKAAEQVFPGCSWKGVCVADGGEGTLEAVVSAAGGRLCHVTVHGPLMEPVDSAYGILPDGRAVIEMAAVSGLPLVPRAKRNPLETTTWGTGELIRDALEQGLRDITVAIGGSATNDGGMGALAALGVCFYDSAGSLLSGKGADLERVERISLEGLMPEVKDARFTVMCDVRNPLTGPEGAAYTFGKQKGGTPTILDRLEAGMLHYADCLEETLGREIRSLPGAGAAGGLGAALLSVLNAKFQPGIEAVLDLIGFDQLLEETDLVVTGEGRMDWQSAFGKVPYGIGMRCKKAGIPVTAIVGGMGKGAENLYQYGIDSVISTVNRAMPLEEALENAEALYRNAAERMFRFVRAGMKIRESEGD